MVGLQDVLANTVWTAALVLTKLNLDHARKYTYLND